LVGVGYAVGIYVGVIGRGWKGVGVGRPSKGTLMMFGPAGGLSWGNRATYAGLEHADNIKNKRINNERRFISNYGGGDVSVNVGVLVGVFVDVGTGVTVCVEVRVAVAVVV
jgi:hypothetical protein